MATQRSAQPGPDHGAKPLARRDAAGWAVFVFGRVLVGVALGWAALAVAEVAR